MTNKILLSVVLFNFYLSWVESAPGTCLSGCLYSVVSPKCSNGGSTLKYNLVSSTNPSYTLNMCGTYCSQKHQTKFFLIRRPSSGSKVITIHMASDCRYALAVENSSVEMQMVTKINSEIPGKFLFKREAIRFSLTFKSTSLSGNYLALIRPNQASLTTSRSKNTYFRFFKTGFCKCNI